MKEKDSLRGRRKSPEMRGFGRNKSLDVTVDATKITYRGRTGKAANRNLAVRDSGQS